MPAFKKGRDIQYQDLCQDMGTPTDGCKTLQDDCWRAAATANCTDVSTRALMCIRNHKCDEYLSGKQNAYILVT